ncbi:sensor histidine kinase [Nocardioides mesophilus]|uniref:histidine kinase n=1 Tax=Nocardioides mesophilus TaxID=433659 RepID=A0A7G9RE08_9ACTN|nr:HAMP domain-containing sensor histidine kinase [Nocardioides mesophilus]QNN53833.1 HAMP domain-containing histidine kinase [Nocardioides mesophilus]
MTRLRFGLRGRVSAAFAVGALVLSVLLAVTTHAIASNYLTDQRYATVLRQAVFNARAVNAALSTTRPAVAQLLEQLEVSSGEASSPLAWVDGRWFADQLPGGVDVLPRSFVAAVEAGRPVQQRFRTRQGLVVAIALPLEPTGGSYVEVFSLRELDQVLTTLAVTFSGTATMTTLLGLLLGLWASRRALRPLSEVTAAAGAIAEGDLGARLQAHRDPDLEGLATAFNRTADRLQARVERDARFAGNVSHELRTPLTTLVNAAELLTGRAARLDTEGREVLGLLTDEVQRFAQMVEDLLEISRADSGAAQMRWEPTALGDLVTLVADRCAGRPVTEVEPGARKVTVAVDRRRLERVVANLVNNAEVHAGGATRVLVSRQPDTVRIAVEDAGPGVSEPDQERIFERFSRGVAHRSDNPDGVGLGLALVFEHVRLHGGRVWAEANEPRGARFVVDLPVRP